MSLTLASIVIPTRDRRAVLARTLEGLALQEHAQGAFEVVIVVNAATDDTLEYLKAARWPFATRTVVVDRPGAALARNEGARAAVAPLLIFLDDDIEVWPGFVRAHIAAHGSTPTDMEASMRVAIGYLPARLQAERDRFAIVLRGWWEAMFDRMREVGHRFSWMDLLSGNCSLSRRSFLAVGGFDTALRCHEDYELGYRLIESGSQFTFVADAGGWHADETRLERACRRKREEGIADAWIAERHPELRTGMPMSRTATVRQRLSRLLAFSWPGAGDRGAAALLRLLPVLERAGATMAWMRVLYAVFGYWYERGLADALVDRARLRGLLAGAWDEPRVRERGLSLDLADGLDAAAGRLDAERPDGARLHARGIPIAEVPWVPGTEPLAGRHLLPLLTRWYHRRTVDALLASGALGIPELLGAPRGDREPLVGEPAMGSPVR